jgi:hypothetical protein
VTSEQAALWSKELFKCVKPVGEPEFRLNGDIGELEIERERERERE